MLATHKSVASPDVPLDDLAALYELGRKPLLIIINYDVTLLPVPTHAQDLKRKLELQDTLAYYVGHLRHRLYLLTGFRAKRIENHIALPNLPVIGLHGLEWPGEPLPNPNWAGLKVLLAHLADLSGVRLENRGLSLLVHYHDLALMRQATIEKYLDTLPLPEGWECVMGKGRREYRPQGCGKGFVIKRLSRTSHRHLVLLGSDSSDEEGFLKLAQTGGTGVKLGVGATQATHRLSDLSDVVGLLEAWARAGQ